LRENLEGNTKQEAEHQAHEAAQEASPWVDRIARFGYVTKGAVYLVVGALAVGVASGMGGQTTDLAGALQTISTQPFGRVMLGFVALGLAAYALWRLVQAVADPEGEGRDAKGIASRLGQGGAGLGYMVLAFTAGRWLVTSGGASSPKEWTALVLSFPLGWVLVLGVGIAVVGYGLHQLYQAYQANFEEYLKREEMSQREESLITHGGRFGLAARGVAIGIAGGFVVLAALLFDPNEAASLGDALQALLRPPFGSFILSVVALGLVAYGLLMIAIARYGRIAPGRAF
jgi:hypothetical protein